GRPLRPLAEHVDGLARFLRAQQRGSKKREREDDAPGGAGRRHGAPLFLSKRRKRWLRRQAGLLAPGSAAHSRCAPSRLPRILPRVASGTGCPATVAGPRRLFSRFPRRAFRGPPRPAASVSAPITASG